MHIFLEGKKTHAMLTSKCVVVIFFLDFLGANQMMVCQKAQLTPPFVTNKPYRDSDAIRHLALSRLFF